MSWSISVKTVGNTLNTSSSTSSSSSSSSSNNNGNDSKDFTIQVEPNEVISSLHRKIEEVTGLESSQQRLIYRGRLISAGAPPTNNTTSTSNTSVHNNNNHNHTLNTVPNENAAAGRADVDTNIEHQNNTEAVPNDNNNNNNDDSEPENNSSTEGEGEELSHQEHDNNNNNNNDHNENHSMSSNSNSTSNNHNNNNARSSASESTVAAETPVKESRICDVVGLSDGQTIHLVPRPNNIVHNTHNNSTNASSNNRRITTGSNNNNNNDSDDANDGSSGNNNGGNSNGSSGAGLLAALLGLGSSNNNNSNNNNSNNNNSTNNNNRNNNDDNDTLEGLEAALSAPSQFRSSSNLTNNNNNNSTTSITSSSTSRRRNPHSYRRSENDPLYPDPCPLEPVRQGLMTLHTMIGEETMNHHNNYNGGQNSNETSGTVTHDNQNENEIKATDNGKELSLSSPSPLNFNRKWYIGQWLDCRDTVNQWLEATVIDIAHPQDLITSVPIKAHASIQKDDDDDDDDDDDKNKNDNSISDHQQQQSITKPYIDPAIGANDLEGRTKLLLEPAEDENDNMLSTYNDNDESLIGYQERKHNSNIQLLKIHYNGWPHRWDEWIRSDSERIRPFRTRSRHVPSMSYYNPSPQSVYRDSPATYITSEEDEVERLDVLPELFDAIDVVQCIFEDATPGIVSRSRRPWSRRKGYFDTIDEDQNQDEEDVSVYTIVPLSKVELDELSNAMKNLQPEKVERVMNIINNDNGAVIGKSIDVADVMVEELEDDVQHKLFCYLLQSSTGRRRRNSHPPVTNTSIETDSDTMLPWSEKKGNHDELSENEQTQAMKSKLKKLNKEKLEALAPLLDRLGRVLVDFAPHVASIAETIPEEPQASESDRQEQDRDGTLDTPIESNDSSSSEHETPTRTITSSFPNSFMPLRPSWSLSRDATNDSTTPLLSSTDANGTNESNDEDESSNQIDPDYVDFVSGFINPASRSEPPRRTVRRSNSDSFGSSLLSAFLASTAGSSSNDDEDGSGPRVLRLGGSTNGGGNGNGNGGIDIHIHAIVTGPNGGGIGGAAGLDGLAGFMSAPTATTTTTASAPNSNSNAGAGVIRSALNADDDDEELGLFSALYAESGQNNENNTSINSNVPYDAEVEIEDEADDIPQLLSDDEVMRRNTSNDSLFGTSHHVSGRPSSSSNSSTGSNSSRRGQLLGRIFRRALTRRNNGGNN